MKKVKKLVVVIMLSGFLTNISKVDAAEISLRTYVGGYQHKFWAYGYSTSDSVYRRVYMCLRTKSPQRMVVHDSFYLKESGKKMETSQYYDATLKRGEGDFTADAHYSTK